MRRYLIFALLALCLCAPLAQAQETGDYALLICSEAEFATLFDMLGREPVGAALTLNDLLDRSAAQIAERENNLYALPLCADAIALQRLFIQLDGDAVARAALDLAALPAELNPYQQLPSDQERIAAVVSALDMLNIDRSAAPPASQRQLPACAAADLKALAETAADLLALLAATAQVAERAQYIESLERRLQWRAANLASLPACAESVEAGTLLSAAATDAATHHAFAYVGVSDQTNPYFALEAAGVAALQSWRALQPNASASISDTELSGLPACACADLATTAAALQPLYATLSSSPATPLSGSVAFSQAPLCAEAFSAGWWLGEAISDAAALSALTGAARRQASSRAAANQAKAAASLKGLESRTSPAAATGRAAACSAADDAFFRVYILPQFRAFVDAALTASNPAAVEDLLSRSGALRDLLWAHLPRCAESLEMGLQMRAIAADFVGLVALEAGGLSALDSPYLSPLNSALDAVYGQIAERYGESGSLGQLYYVTADGFANVRACASTNCQVVAIVQTGDILNVTDAAGQWLELMLPNGDTAYIASFLASQSPP